MVMLVCFQKSLHFKWYLFGGFFVHKSDHSEGKGGTDRHFQKVTSALPADGRLGNGGADRGEREAHI